MKLNAHEVPLFENLSQSVCGEAYFDFHNDFSCVEMKYELGFFNLIFKSHVESSIVSIKFEKTLFVCWGFAFSEHIESLTIDNLYRGKFEHLGSLIEFMSGKGYFYLEFYEDLKLEFWCESIVIEAIDGVPITQLDFI